MKHQQYQQNQEHKIPYYQIYAVKQLWKENQVTEDNLYPEREGMTA
jgi:hypothetical protein